MSDLTSPQEILREFIATDNSVELTKFIDTGFILIIQVKMQPTEFSMKAILMKCQLQPAYGGNTTKNYSA